jgi:hypothetical protein
MRACKIWNTKNYGKEAGNTHIRTGRRVITIDKTHYTAPRIIWLIVFRSWPDFDIDHVDNDPQNNRLSNLREAKRSENLWNRRVNRNNSCGLKGVSLDKRRNLWKAEIMTDRKRKFLGYFKTKEEAHEAYVSASLASHGDFSIFKK